MVDFSKFNRDKKGHIKDKLQYIREQKRKEAMGSIEEHRNEISIDNDGGTKFDNLDPDQQEILKQRFQNETVRQMFNFGFVHHSLSGREFVSMVYGKGVKSEHCMLYNVAANKLAFIEDVTDSSYMTEAQESFWTMERHLECFRQIGRLITHYKAKQMGEDDLKAKQDKALEDAVDTVWGSTDIS